MSWDPALGRRHGPVQLSRGGEGGSCSHEEYLAERSHDPRPELAELEGKLFDLPPVVRNHVYDLGFKGSFSLKAILHPMVPELTYDDLVIVDGRVASVEIAGLLFVAHKIPEEERDRVRRDLLEYCERDTWATVKLLERLQQLAAG